MPAGAPAPPAEVPAAAGAPAPPAELPAAPVGAAYSRTLKVLPEKLTVGDKAEVRLEVRALLPWALREGVPCTGTLALTPGLAGAQVVEPAALVLAGDAGSLLWSIEARGVGGQEVSVGLDCFLCTDTVCQRYVERVRVGVLVSGT